jgi:hypothetical protein
LIGSHSPPLVTFSGPSALPLVILAFVTAACTSVLLWGPGSCPAPRTRPVFLLPLKIFQISVSPIFVCGLDLVPLSASRLSSTTAEFFPSPFVPGPLLASVLTQIRARRQGLLHRFLSHPLEFLSTDLLEFLLRF